MKSYQAIVRRAAAACGAECAQLKLADGLRIGEIPPGWFELARVPVAGEDGFPLGTLSVASESMRQLSVRELAALHDFADIAAEISVAPRDDDAAVFSRAVEESLDLVLVTDVTPPSGGGPFIQYANTPLLRATGYALEDILGKAYSLLFASSNDTVALQSVAGNIESGRDIEKELLVCRKDGSSFWVEFTGRPMADASGQRRHWIVVGRDITTRRRAHEQLSALLNAIDAVEHHIEIYVLENGQYTLTFQNAAANSDTSELLETLLNEGYIPGITPLREQIKAGQTVTVTPDGLEIRPLGKNAETLICIRQKAS